MGRYTTDVLKTMGANVVPSPDPADRPFTRGVWGYDIVNIVLAFDGEFSLTYAGNPNGQVASKYVGRKLFDTVGNDIYICTTAGTIATAVWMSMTQHVIDKVAQSQAAAPNIVALAMGQSLIANWSVINPSAGYNKDGETAFITTLNTYNTGGTTTFINGAVGSSYLSRKAYDAANARAGGTLLAGNYWVDDTVTPRVAGPRLNEAMTKVETSGKTLNQVGVVIWSQGESDASGITFGDITSQEYYDDLVWLKDFYFASMTSLRRMMIRPIGRRSDAANNQYELIRINERLLAENYPYQVSYGSETFDLPMRDETGVSDGVHRSGAGFATEGARAAREAAYLYNLYSGNSVGPHISNVTYTGGNVVLTVTHDKGTALANKAGTAYAGTPISITPTGLGYFTLVDSTGANIPISNVNITGANQITIVPSTPLATAGNTLRCGYGAMFGIDLNSVPYDNASNPLPLRASHTASIDGSLTAIETMANLVSFFSPETMYATGNTGSSQDIWKKRAGSGGSARKDGTKAAPVRYDDISTVIPGGPHLPGWYFDGTSGQKLLVENALTSSSNFTLFVVATPDANASDPSTNNVLIGTSATPSASVPLFLVRQSQAAPQTLNFYCGTAGTTVDYDHANTTTVLAMRRNGSICNTWNEVAADNTFTVSGTPQIDTDTNPVYALGNMPLHGTGSSDVSSTFRGAIHYVVLFDVALSDAQILQIRTALATAVGI